MKKENIRYYSSYNDDFIETKEQEFQISGDYQWIRTNLGARILSKMLYSIAVPFATIYCKVFLHVRLKNRWVMRAARKTGAFVYCNHTQPIGDVFLPALVCWPMRIYTIASPANLGIPMIGKILPYLGALPIADSLEGLKKLNEAIEFRAKQKHAIVIYPEAHVWEYCTEIRPFPNTSFKYPVKLDKPVYCITTTYQKRRFGKRPKATLYVDGPFWRNTLLNTKRQAVQLRDIVYECMQNRSLQSTYAYIQYEKKIES